MQENYQVFWVKICLFFPKISTPTKDQQSFGLDNTHPIVQKCCGWTDIHLTSADKRRQVPNQAKVDLSEAELLAPYFLSE